MFYCSEKHLRRHARVLGHADECARMAQQLDRRKVCISEISNPTRKRETDAVLSFIRSWPVHAVIQELHGLPFTFAEELTAGINSGSATMCTFLQRHGLHNRALWQRECSCSQQQPWGSLAPEAVPPAAALFAIGAQVPPQVGFVISSDTCMRWH